MADIILYATIIRNSKITIIVPHNTLLWAWNPLNTKKKYRLEEREKSSWGQAKKNGHTDEHTLTCKLDFLISIKLEMYIYTIDTNWKVKINFGSWIYSQYHHHRHQHQQQQQINISFTFFVNWISYRRFWSWLWLNSPWIRNVFQIPF